MNWLKADLNLNAPGSATYLVHVDTLQSTSHKTQMLDSHFHFRKELEAAVICPTSSYALLPTSRFLL